MRGVHGHVAMPRFPRVSLRSEASGAWRRRLAVGTDRRSAPLHRNFHVALATRAAPSRASRHGRCEERSSGAQKSPGLRSGREIEDACRRGVLATVSKWVKSIENRGRECVMVHFHGRVRSTSSIKRATKWKRIRDTWQKHVCGMHVWLTTCARKRRKSWSPRGVNTFP